MRVINRTTESITVEVTDIQKPSGVTLSTDLIFPNQMVIRNFPKPSIPTGEKTTIYRVRMMYSSGSIVPPNRGGQDVFVPHGATVVFGTDIQVGPFADSLDVD